MSGSPTPLERVSVARAPTLRDVDREGAIDLLVAALTLPARGPEPWLDDLRAELAPAWAQRRRRAA